MPGVQFPRFSLNPILTGRLARFVLSIPVSVENAIRRKRYPPLRKNTPGPAESSQDEDFGVCRRQRGNHW